ncbi:MAG TPA: DeoR/GlpR family DNA-binding transcription regulator [Phycisphaerae bacterium]|nr:DeoR/GlpR family DNA-binding transcription regulator [Phycisphaerae bacterium]
MLAQQRQREILSQLGRGGGVRVAPLAKAFAVAQETIRRDLDKLESEGRLVRTHGGAVPVQNNRRELPFDLRKVTNLEAKKAIAARALRHVSEGDVIAVDASSTVHELARIIPDMPLTVITNSLPVAAFLVDGVHIRVVATGGMLDAPSRSFTGTLAEHALERFNVNKLFLSAKGVDLARGLSEATDEQARVKRRMIDAAERTYLLADHGKFGVRSVVFYASPADVDLVITDAGTDAAVIEELTRMGVKTDIAG